MLAGVSVRVCMNALCFKGSEILKIRVGYVDCREWS